MPALVSDAGLPYFAHLSTDGKKITFDPPYSEGPGLYNITLQISSDGLYKISYFYLTVVNTPPYNVTILPNTEVYVMSMIDYNTVKNVDPEGNTVKTTFVNISKSMIPYYSYNSLKKSFTFMPEIEIFELQMIKADIIARVYYNISDGFYNVTLNFNVTIK